jgi:general secretion pathway protein D
MTPQAADAIRGAARALLAAIAILAAVACVPPPREQPPIRGGHLYDPTVGGATGAADGAVVSTARPRGAPGGGVIAQDLREAPAAQAQSRTPTLQGPPVALNLADAQVEEAAAVVLGDVLGLPYALAPDAAGTVSIRADRPIPRPQLLALFESALEAQGLALYEQDGLFRIAQAGAAPQDQATILPRHVAATELARALELVLPPEQIRVVGFGAGEGLVITGDAGERDRARRLVAAMDREALAGMSLTILGLGHANPEALSAELGAIFGGDAAPAVGGDGLAVSSGALRIVPLERLGAVALLARDRATLDRALGIARRLDRPRPGGAERLFVYRVQNRSAASLAESLTTLFAAEAADPDDFGARAFDDPPRIAVDAERNALVIAAPPGAFQQLVDLISQLDSAPMQVLVEATILEVGLGDELRFGVQYAWQTGELFDGRSGVGLLTSGASQAISPTLPGFAFSIGTRLAPEIIIEALDDVTELTVVSSPKLLVRDNQSARLQIGDQVPIITQSAEGLDDTSRVVNSVEYRDTGVTLVVTPRVNAGGFVNLSVQQEVSSVTQTTTSGIDSPTISRRQITTDVTVRSGETVVLGGLIQDRQSLGRSGIPVAQDIPIIGPLFGTRGQSAQRSELLALLRPHILGSPERAADLTESLRRDFELIFAEAQKAGQLRRLDPVTLPRPFE